MDRVKLYCLVIVVMALTHTGTYMNSVYALDSSSIEHLKFAIGKLQSNIGQIRTWSGNVKLEGFRNGPDPGSEYTNFAGSPVGVANVSFWSDVVSGKSSCQYQAIKGGTPDFYDEICTLFVDGVLYEISRFQNVSRVKKDGLSYESKLGIRLVDKNNISGLFATHFIPIEKTDYNKLVFILNGYLEIAQKEPANKTSHIHVSVKDKVLTIETTIKSAYARYAVDLDKGGMPIEVLSIDSGKGVHWKCNLQKVSNIWIPKETFEVMDLTDGTREWEKCTWLKNSLNVPISDDSFSLKVLKLHRGTLVYDYRTGVEHVIEGEEYPPLPGTLPEYKRATYFRYVIITLGILMIVTALFIEYRKWRARRAEAKQ
jgi:hypothetical protein